MQTNKPERVGGIDFVVKDGIVYDAKKLLPMWRQGRESEAAPRRRRRDRIKR